MNDLARRESHHTELTRNLGATSNLMGGADLIRQALAAGLVNELAIIIAPVTLGAGKRLFEGFGGSMRAWKAHRSSGLVHEEC